MNFLPLSQFLLRFRWVERLVFPSQTSPLARGSLLGPEYGSQQVQVSEKRSEESRFWLRKRDPTCPNGDKGLKGTSRGSLVVEGLNRDKGLKTGLRMVAVGSEKKVLRWALLVPKKSLNKDKGLKKRHKWVAFGSEKGSQQGQMLKNATRCHEDRYCFRKKGLRWEGIEKKSHQGRSPKKALNRDNDPKGIQVEPLKVPGVKAGTIYPGEI